ncbi:unnamed protein product [Cyprideis torosa]|uniref:Uncharacterized protein n=1 Tax=Cyprideis torosa TaxID=163714 RepID=A0A7R8ZKJ7_9CRUS|nr:unnamed protein product [Cyprideis torosa]CAG0880393.1 unnamed protein product [Cyprideis torosa]
MGPWTPSAKATENCSLESKCQGYRKRFAGVQVPRLQKTVRWSPSAKATENGSLESKCQGYRKRFAGFQVPSLQKTEHHCTLESKTIFPSPEFNLTANSKLWVFHVYSPPAHLRTCVNSLSALRDQINSRHQRIISDPQLFIVKAADIHLSEAAIRTQLTGGASSPLLVSPLPTLSLLLCMLHGAVSYYFSCVSAFSLQWRRSSRHHRRKMTL